MKNNHGFTLLELLVAILLIMAALGAGYSVFFASTRTSNTQTQVSRMQDNARMAMDVLSRDFRRLGFLADYDCYPAGQLISGVSTKLVHINSSVNPDDVTIVGGDIIGATTPLLVPASEGDSSLTLENAAEFNIGDVIGIGITETGVITAKGGNTVTLETKDIDNNFMPRAVLNLAYPAKFLSDGTTLSNMTPTQINKIAGTHYQVVNPDATTGGPVLRRDGQVVAENIEDLQIVYGVDSNKNGMIETAEMIHTPAGDDIENIRIVFITIVARTEREDPGFAGQGLRPAAGDHLGADPATERDGFRRLVLTRAVRCRNMSILAVL